MKTNEKTVPKMTAFYMFISNTIRAEYIIIVEYPCNYLTISNNKNLFETHIYKYKYIYTINDL